MKTKALGFIGGGRITKIFLQAFLNVQETFESIVVYDTNPEVLSALKQEFPEITIAENVEQAARQSTVFIALHPPVIMETLDAISGLIEKNALIVSLAPKISIEKISMKLKTNNVARTIPNATSYINDGYNPIAYHPDMRKTDRRMIKMLVKKLGKTIRVEERKLEGYAIISAMLPTYFWFQFEEMEKIAQQCGLSEEEAAKTVKATLKRAIKTYYNSGLSPAEVMGLIPVKPIGEHEAEIKEIYQTKLMGLFGKIKP
jgi:pyrroline-5-carboxylate reductase